MKVRLGYACITNCINDSSSSPYTYGEYLKDGDIDKLDRVIISNLKSLNKQFLCIYSPNKIETV